VRQYGGKKIYGRSIELFAQFSPNFYERIQAIS